MRKMAKELVGCLVLVIVGTTMAVYGLKAWDRSHWPDLMVISQESNVLTIWLDKELTIGTDMANQRASEAVLKICEDGYRVKVVNWSAVSPTKILTIVDARILVNPDRNWITTYRVLSDGQIHAYINAYDEKPKRTN